MPDPTTIERLRGLILSAKDLREITDWPGALIEDYLNILDNIITIANLLDIEIDQTIEEIPTDFADGSIPFVEDGFLVEDNTNLVWDILNNILTALNLLSETITLSSATASRLLSTNASKILTSVAALTDHGLLVASGTGDITPLAVATNGQLPIGSAGADPVLATLTGTANQITVTNAAGSITFSIPDPFVAPGIARQVRAFHAYGGFEDQAETITCGAGDWNHITNGTNDLWNLDEADGISEAADVFTIDNTGDYWGNLSLSISGLNGKDFHVRVYNNTQTRVEGRPIGISTTGANNEMNVSVPIYIEATAADAIQFEIMSADGSDPVVDDGLFTLAYLHD